MKGTVSVKVNNATLVEALQEYFDRHLNEGLRMTVSAAVLDAASQYTASLGVEVTLTEKESAAVA